MGRLGSKVVLRTAFALAVLALIAWGIYLHYHGVMFSLGLYPSQPPWTNSFYQGLLPDVMGISVLGTWWGYYKRNNCQVEKCLRIGRYEVNRHKVCWRHHPSDHITRKGMTPQKIAEIHEELSSGKSSGS